MLELIIQCANTFVGIDDLNDSAFSGSFFGHKLFFSMKSFAAAALSSTSPVDTFILTRFPAFSGFLSLQTQLLSTPAVSQPYTQECVSHFFPSSPLFSLRVEELESLSALTHNSSVPTAEQVLQSFSLPFYIFYLLSVFCSISLPVLISPLVLSSHSAYAPSPIHPHVAIPFCPRSSATNRNMWASAIGDSRG